MSYATTSHYEAEILFRNRLAPPPEPTMGNNPGRNTPLNRTDDNLTRGKAELLAENVLLRHQLIILRRQIKRPVYRKTDRVLLVFLARMVRTWKQALYIVQPETLLRLPS